MPESTRRGRAALEAAFADEIHRRLIDRVAVEPQVVIIAVVGEGMRGTPGIAASSSARWASTA